MPKRKDERVYTWNDLEGQVTPEVLHAPRTCGDPTGSWPEVHSRIIRYLVRRVVGKPWADHLTLIVAVFTAQRRDVWTVEQALRVLNAGFSSLFSHFQLEHVSQWSIEQHLAPYVRGVVFPQKPLQARINFSKRYMSATHLVASWCDFLPTSQQEQYRRFLLPMTNLLLAEEFAKMDRAWTRQQQELRKEETEAVVPQFTALRATAHFRFNRMTRLWQAYQQALSQVLPDHSNLPLDFSYEEGDPPAERMLCRLWDRRSFVLHPDHAQLYASYTLTCARNKRRAFRDDHNEVFLELITVERLVGNGPPEGLWFTELVKLGMLGQKPLTGTEEEVEAKQAWLRQWGYGGDDPKDLQKPFYSQHAGLLAWPETGRATGYFMTLAQQRTQGALIPVESLYAATTFGLLALELFTTTGIHVTWNMPPSLFTFTPLVTSVVLLVQR